jgi:hypothetical protein
MVVCVRARARPRVRVFVVFVYTTQIHLKKKNLAAKCYRLSKFKNVEWSFYGNDDNRDGNPSPCGLPRQRKHKVYYGGSIAY